VTARWPGWRPVVIRKRAQSIKTFDGRAVLVHTPRWEVRHHGRLVGTYPTGVQALASIAHIPPSKRTTE
jgi:hypothetical protein